MAGVPTFLVAPSCSRTLATHTSGEGGTDDGAERGREMRWAGRRGGDEGGNAQGTCAGHSRHVALRTPRWDSSVGMRMSTLTLHSRHTMLPHML